MTNFLGQKRLIWYGHVLKKEGADTAKKKKLNMQEYRESEIVGGPTTYG